MPSLYVVATPIGNLEDITLRALRVLREVELIAAEDTRVTRRLLDRYDICTPLVSYHEHNKISKLPMLLAALDERNVALVSDAGTPSISDPGSELIEAAAAASITVIPIPGPSAVTSAIAVSGLPIGSFVYLGFLPRKRTDRRKLLLSLQMNTRVLVTFETPRRLIGSLEEIRDILGDRSIVVCRELTKLYEEIFRGTVTEALNYFERPRGEFTIVITGCRKPMQSDACQEQVVRDTLHKLWSEGVRAREAVSQVVEQSGLTRRNVYRMWLEVKEQIQSIDD